MPESMSLERCRITGAYGAQLELRQKEKGMRGTIDRAEELVEKMPKAWMPQQFVNPANIEAHKQFTAREILDDYPDGLDYLITGVGTGGHITGCGEILKQHFPRLKVYAVEPELSPVISGGSPGFHPLQGIGAGFIPENLHTSILNGVITVTDEEYFEYTRRCVRKEGILVGISLGAALAAVAKKLGDIPDNSTVLTFNHHC